MIQETTMRLLYQHIVQGISKNDCGVIINDLKTHVATNFRITWNVTKKNAVFRFLTTSRPVEAWLQKIEDSIKLMRQKKEPFEFWVVTGGYGAGKSHMKEYLRRNEIKNLKFLEPGLSSMLQFKKHAVPVNDIYSLILLEIKPLLKPLYSTIKDKLPIRPNVDVNEDVKKTIRDYSIDDDFVNAFCTFAKSGNNDRHDSQKLEEQIIKCGEQLFLPIMKLLKSYLKTNGLCIFIDEFESLQFLDSEKRMRFVQSLRPFYDTVASTRSDPTLPSLKIIVLCTLSFWNELTSDTRSHALESRVHLFEIPPLVEDEIKALAEKVYAIHKKSDIQSPEIQMDFNNLPAYLVKRAGIEAPLTPRFVIQEIIKTIEKPNDYLKFNPDA